MNYSLHFLYDRYVEYHFSNGMIINQWAWSDDTYVTIKVPDNVKVTKVVVSSRLRSFDATVITPDNGVTYPIVEDGNIWHMTYSDFVRVCTDHNAVRHMEHFASVE